MELRGKGNVEECYEGEGGASRGEDLCWWRLALCGGNGYEG